MKYLFFLFLSSISFAQQTENVDFLKCNALLYPNAKEKSISGSIKYTFKVNQLIDSIRIDAKNMNFSNLLINGKVVKFKNSKNELVLYEGYKKGNNTVEFSFSAQPKQTLYFIGEGDEIQIWTQGQGRYTSHWLPSFDDVNEKVIFHLSVVHEHNFEKRLSNSKTVLCNGILKSKKSTRSWSRGVDTFTWNYSMDKPMSSYLVMLAIGNFIKQDEKAQSGIPLEYYLDKNDSLKFEPTYRYSKQMFDYFEKEIGVKYPWKIYRQVPVRDFLYAGMENTTSTIFAQDYVVDAIGFNDRNYVNVNAHELAHQWFGDLVTAKSGKHHWLQEGFATYYALLAEKEVFGDDYFYYELYKTANQLRNAAKTDTIPVLNEKASSLTFYQKGAWALHVLKESIGEKAFRKTVKNFLKKHKFKNAETDDFLREVNKVSDFDTDNFKTIWLEKSGFEYDQAISLLTKNKCIADFLEIKKVKELTSSNFDTYYNSYKNLLQSDVFYPSKLEIINQIKKIDFQKNKELLEIALNSNSIELHKKIVQSFPKIPHQLKVKFEAFLDANSYDLREITFINLWNTFPDSREKYLLKAQNWFGNNDKSLRIVYLAYSQLLTNYITDAEKDRLYHELQNYTSPMFESSVRQNAFDVILEINKKDVIVLKNLINALSHIKWRFKSYARDRIKDLLVDKEVKSVIESLLPALEPIDRERIDKILLN